MSFHAPRGRTATPLMLLAALLVACDEGGGPDAAPRPDAFVDAALDADGSPDAARDAAPPGPVESCQDACDRFAACGRLGDVFGDEAACLAACERSARAAAPAAFYDCLEVEACNLLHLCRLPAPPPLTCAEVCDAADACEADLPFDCATACAAEPAAVADCGERLVAHRCDVEGFAGCVAAAVYTGCDRRCERARACAVEVPDDCLRACIAEGADPDPLHRLRQQQQNACVNLAGADCARVDLCLHPEHAPPPPPVNRQTFCALWNACPWAAELPCNVVWDELLGPVAPPGAAECAVGVLDLGCPGDPFQLFEQCFRGGPPPAQGPACVELCEALDVCDHPDAAPDRLACLTACSDDLAIGGDPAARRRLRFPCGTAESCDALEACLVDTDPAVPCAAHCEALDACGAADAERCAADCDADFPRDRHAAWRACVAAAEGDCEAVAACAPAPSLPCELQCQRLVACGHPAGHPATCAGRCDDEHFADPATAERRFACALSAPACHGPGHTVAACLDDPEAGGADCLGYCRAQGPECGGERPLAECLAVCGQGFTGDEAVRFMAARACLAGVDPAGACEALVACLPEAVEADCEGWCGGLEACGLDDAGCAARCGADPLTTARALEQAACVRATGGDCAAVEACRRVIPEPPPPFDQAAFCAHYDACALFDHLGFLCADALDLLRDQGGPQTLQCAYETLLEGCPADPLAAVLRCRDPQPPTPEVDACAALCDARALCDALDGPTPAECRAACVDTLRHDPDAAARLRPALDCAEARACDELAVCLEARSTAAACARQCAALAGCGLDEGGDGCAEACDADFARRRHAAWRTCVAEAGEDCDAVAACTPAPGLPCDRYCARLGECRVGRAGCVDACDDAWIDDPLDTAAQVTCVLSADACGGLPPDGHTVEACLFTPDPADRPGAECLAWCRAVTDCDPEADRELVECALACAAGFDDEEALAFHTARACLDGAGPGAACPALRACVPDEPPAVDCDAHCDALAACGVAPAECGCPAPAVAGCVLEARRLRRGCGAVAECVGFEAPEVPAACDALCDRRTACDAAQDPFACRLGCAAHGPALAVRAACAEASLCGDLPVCLALDAGPVPDCVEPCADAAACGAFADAATCEAVCTGHVRSPRAPDDFAAGLGACVDAAACDPATTGTCFALPPLSCEGGCGLLVDCGLFPPGDPTCVTDCHQAQLEDPRGTGQVIECMFTHLGDDRCDFDGFFVCAEGVAGAGGEPPPR